MPFLCGCPGVDGEAACPFFGRGATMSSARRAVRGHALREHQRVFIREGLPLTNPGPGEVAERLDAYRRGQRSATQRRNEEADLLDALSTVADDVGPAAGPSSSLRAASVRAEGGLPAAHLPDLSAGSVPIAPTPTTAFLPPRGFDAAQMADFLRDHLGRRPSALAAMLAPPGSDPDEVTLYWVGVMAVLQRSLGRDLRAMLEDQLAVDPSGRSAFNRAVDVVGRLARRPLDDERTD